MDYRADHFKVFFEDVEFFCFLLKTFLDANVTRLDPACLQGEQGTAKKHNNSGGNHATNSSSSR
jgi:hypothetical protein